MLFTADELIEKSKDQRNRHRYEEALVSSISATVIDIDSAEAWWQVALNQMSINDTKNALLALERTVDLAPNFVTGWVMYGELLLKTGDEDLAHLAFKSALDQDPERKEALEALADIYLSQNKDNQETDDCELSILTKLDYVSGLSSARLNRIGILHYQRKSFFEAIKYWRRCVSLSPNDYSNLFNLGLAYYQEEVSQYADAVDLWRLALKYCPSYGKAQEQINKILPGLLALAKNASKHNFTILPKEQWYSFYINPFALLNPPNDLKIEDFDAKMLQRLQKILLQEIELEEGCIAWLANMHIDKSKAIGVCDDLNDSKKRNFHWYVFKNKKLLDFLTFGSHAHFLVNESTSPLQIIELLENRENGFLEWLSEAFSKQFDLVLSKAITQKNLVILECLLNGRRWINQSHEDKCFENSRRQVDSLLDPLRNINKCADDVMPTIELVTDILQKGEIIDILKLLPVYFQDIQNEVPTIIRSLGVSCYNTHSNAYLSKSMLLTALTTARKFPFKSVTFVQNLDDDCKKIDEILLKQEEIIREELKYEVRLTSGGNKWEITKDGVSHGERYFPTSTVISARWGTIINRVNNEKSYDYLISFKDKEGEEISFSWTTSTDIEKSEKYFNDYLDATYNYLLPSIIEKIDNRLKSGNVIQIGKCSITEQGIQFETKGWIFSETQFVPWQRVHLDIENGELVVSDISSPKVKTEMSLRLVDNAPVLYYFWHFKTQN